MACACCRWRRFMTAPPTKGEVATAPLRAFGTPLLDFSARLPYRTIQAMYDPLHLKGRDRSYFRSLYMPALALDERIIDQIVSGLSVRPSEMTYASVFGMLATSCVAWRQMRRRSATGKSGVVVQHRCDLVGGRKRRGQYGVGAYATLVKRMRPFSERTALSKLPYRALMAGYCARALGQAPMTNSRGPGSNEV